MQALYAPQRVDSQIPQRVDLENLNISFLTIALSVTLVPYSLNHTQRNG
jgi:hypothetical protein